MITHKPVRGCAYVIGFSDVRKLGEAALIGPALTDLKIGITSAFKFTRKLTYIQENNAGKVQYHGKAQFPPAKATLLAFGFMPVTVTLQLSEIGTLNAIFITEGPGSHGCIPPHCKLTGLTTVSSRLSLRVYNVKVNGVPLDVGPACETATPFNAVLKGVYPKYSINTGGPLSGTLTIPPFKGCGAGTENLDVIFTAPVSGSDNFTKLTQGPPCTPINESGCNPIVIPTPQR
jgi:hypothetical protein